MDLNEFVKKMPHAYITDAEIAVLLGGTAHSRYSKIKRLIAQGKLLHIRRGLYQIREHGSENTIHPFELAQFIYGPSYISLESALSFHQLIPEAVRTITSVTCKRSKQFQTPIGLFTFQHVPHAHLYTNVERIHENHYTFYIATPWKAICDYIYCYKKTWASLDACIEDLRLDIDVLPLPSDTQLQQLDDYYQHSRVRRCLAKLSGDLAGFTLKNQ